MRPYRVFFLILIIGFLNTFSAFSVHAKKHISLEQAIDLALQNDPWLHGSRLQQKALEDRSVASGTLPDPKVSLGMINLPMDSWDFNQEGMTQFKLGVSQIFSRGNSLEIKESQLKIEATKFPLLRENRKAKLKSMISELWLDVYLAQRTIELIENDWALFEQMTEIANVNYSNAVGKTRQQDVIRAQLEIVQLDDRLMVEKQQLETSTARLNEWLHVFNENNLDNAFNFDVQPVAFKVSKKLPAIQLAKPTILKPSSYSRNRLARELSEHPALAAMDIKQQISKKEIQLAKQQYKPQFGLNASYGYRDNMPSGDSRDDFFSVGITFDIPLFTENRQDKHVSASIADSEVIKTEKLLLIKQMISAVEKEVSQLKRLSSRQLIYQNQLLKQTHEQAEASLTAYTNDDGDFSEVVRARIAELNAKISALKIDIDALKTVVRINYFLAQSNLPKQLKQGPHKPSQFNLSQLNRSQMEYKKNRDSENVNEH